MTALNARVTYAKAPSRYWSYDGVGSTTGNGSAVFGYDDANRLTSVTQGASSTSFVLNALGQRVSKAAAGGITLFAYDESGHLVGEYDGAGHLIEETVWLGEIPVATLRPDPAGGIDIYYVHSDHLNTPRRVTRPSDNAVVWAWTSDPFGNGFTDQNPDGDGQYFIYNLRFPGQYYDSETGLSYNYLRDYDPAVGRYIESDPIGLAGGSYSTYSYANGNPVSITDPTGLMGFGGGGAGGAAAHYVWPTRPPSPTLTPAAKAILCKALKDCAGDLQCAFNELNSQRKQNGWYDQNWRDAENFATSAAPNSATGYGYAWAAHHGLGVYVYQYAWKPYVNPYITQSTPVSDEAYEAGMAGLALYGDPPAQALKYCSDCTAK
jgi:RHS repeat-associated protein